jgi:hypothetical protein
VRALFGLSLRVVLVAAVTLPLVAREARSQTGSELASYDLYIPENKKTPNDGPHVTYVVPPSPPKKDISLALDDVPIRDALKTLAEKTGYRFGVVRGFSGTVDILVYETRWTDVLAKILEQQPLKVDSRGDLILLTPDPEQMKGAWGHTAGVIFLVLGTLSLIGGLGYLLVRRFSATPKGRPANVEW